MDRFHADFDDEDQFDTVEPMRGSSFDMSFTFGGGSMDQDLVIDSVAKQRPTNINQEYSNTKPLLRRIHSDQTNENISMHLPYRKSSFILGGHTYGTDISGEGEQLRSSDNILHRLEEKTHETIILSSLSNTNLQWKLSKREKDVRVYTPKQIPKEDKTKVYFRVSCEMKSDLQTIMAHLMPRDGKKYHEIEDKVFPGFLFSTVIKQIRIKDENKGQDNQDDNINSPRNQLEHIDTQGRNQDPPYSSSVYENGIDENIDNLGENNYSGIQQINDEYMHSEEQPFPCLTVKWHASRFAGWFVKPFDFFFAEYANIEVLPNGQQRGIGYMRSVDSLKAIDCANRMSGEGACIPKSVHSCKRGLINKAVYIISPLHDYGNNVENGEASTYEVTMMMVIDFGKQYTAGLSMRVISTFTDRLISIREVLYNTLFRPVSVLAKGDWKPALRNSCAVCHEQFSFMKHEHHCRSCGEAVCGQCSRKWQVQNSLIPTDDRSARLCTPCSLLARKRTSPPSSQSVQENGHILSQSFNFRSSHTDLELLTSPRYMSQTLVNTVNSQNHHQLSGCASASVKPNSINIPNINALVLEASASSANNEEEEKESISDDVRVATGFSKESNSTSAVVSAFADLVQKLGDNRHPHFMLVSYSSAHDGLNIYEALAIVAPNTLFMGGSSSDGIFSETDFVSNGSVHGLSLWGVYDPKGAYTVLNTDFKHETTRDGTHRCITQGKHLIGLEKSAAPDFVWFNACANAEDGVVSALNSILDCASTIVGGSSSHSGNSKKPSTQICSEGGSCVTTHGACFAICTPSVHIVHSLFTCYESQRESTPAVVVTKGNRREVMSLDHKPAFIAFDELCCHMFTNFLSDPSEYSLTQTKLSDGKPSSRERMMVMYCLYREKGRSTKQSDVPQLLVIQPMCATKENTLNLGVAVQVGEKLRLCCVTEEMIQSRLQLGYLEILSSSKVLKSINREDILGAVVSVSSNYSKLEATGIQGIARLTIESFGRCAVQGFASLGQQGILSGEKDVVHANGMVTTLIFTNKKKNKSRLDQNGS